MNIILVILLVLLATIALLLVVALFIPREYLIRREIIIERSVSEVFNYIKFLENQDHFSKWVRVDPDMKKDHRGVDGTVGFVYAWDGNNKAGAGEQEIIDIRDGERIDIEIRFIRPFESIAKTAFLTERIAENQTRVIWSMDGKSKYPLNLMNLLMGGMLGKDLQTGLEMLKNNLEKVPTAKSY